MSLLAHLLLPADGDPPTCNLQWICKQLGHDGTDASKVAYIGGLIMAFDFPKPLPHLAHGGFISPGIHATRSQWVRAGVEAWLADYLPPAGAVALDAAAQRAAAADMDNAALCLKQQSDRQQNGLKQQSDRHDKDTLRVVGGTEA